MATAKRVVQSFLREWAFGLTYSDYAQRARAWVGLMNSGSMHGHVPDQTCSVGSLVHVPIAGIAEGRFFSPVQQRPGLGDNVAAGDRAHHAAYQFGVCMPRKAPACIFRPSLHRCHLSPPSLKSFAQLPTAHPCLKETP